MATKKVSTMYRQTETKYKSVMLGFGSGSIYSYGCYLVSLCNALNVKGYSFTPESLNQLFKENNCFVGEFKNYIDVTSLPKKFPDIFSSFVSVEPFSDSQLASYISTGLSVVAKVDARGIGGTGSHFVLVTKYDGKVSTIYDPWFGDEQLVTYRYSKYNNLLGLRVFNIKRYKPETTNMNLFDPELDLPTWLEDKYDLKSKAWYDKSWNFGDLVEKTDELYKTEQELKVEIDNLNERERISDQRRAELASVVSERDKMVTTLNNEINRLKNEIEGVSDHSSHVEKENQELLIEIEKLKDRLESESIFNLIKKWLKR